MAKQRAKDGAKGPVKELFAKPPEGYRLATPEEERFINDQGAQMMVLQARMDTQAARIEQHSAQLELARRDSITLLGQLKNLQDEIRAYNKGRLGLEDKPGDIVERQDGSIIICVDPKKRMDGKGPKKMPAPPATATPEAAAPPLALIPPADKVNEKKGGK